MKKATYPSWKSAAGVGVLLTVASLTHAQNSATSPMTPAAPSAPSSGAPAASAETTSDQIGYLFGLTFGEQLHSVGVSSQLDSEAVARGLKDALQGKKSTRADQERVQAYVRQAMVDEVARNQTAARDFLVRNGHDKGVKTTADGLQYRVLAAGNAKAPPVSPTDEVTVNYRGKLLDGTEFDSSYSRNAPATFRANGVIKGWQEALVLMKPGAKWQLFVPPELGYDTSPRPGIPGGSLLIFDVELLNAKPAATPPAARLPQGAPQTGPAASHRVAPPLKPSSPTDQ